MQRPMRARMCALIGHRRFDADKGLQQRHAPGTGVAPGPEANVDFVRPDV